MSNHDDMPLPDPHEERVPCVLALDTSGSMTQYDHITKLNESLNTFQDNIRANPLASIRVEVAVIKFGGTVGMVQDFTRGAEGLNIPKLEAAGETPMGQAVILALNMLEDRKRVYNSQGIKYQRPWLFVITDGYPTDTDAFKAAVEEVKSQMAARHVLVWGIAVGESVGEQGKECLKSISGGNAYALKPGFSFAELFKFVSNSLSRASDAVTGDEIRLTGGEIFLKL